MSAFNIALYLFAAVGFIALAIFVAVVVMFVIVAAVDRQMDVSSGGRQQ